MQAREPHARRNVARQQIETARNMLRNHDILTNWNYLPEHLSAAEAHVDALVTWHDWATGKPVTPDRLIDTVTTLHDIAAHEPDNGARQLANVIHEWAQQHGVELTAPPVQQQRTTRTSIEVDL